MASEIWMNPSASTSRDCPVEHGGQQEGYHARAPIDICSYRMGRRLRGYTENKRAESHPFVDRDDLSEP